MLKSNKLDEVFDFINSKALTLNKQIKLSSMFRDSFESEYPFIQREKDFFYSEHEPIKNYRFTTENEVILANAIYESTKENFDLNEFNQMFKFSLRLLNVDSIWSK